jgi:hypothetical protein
MARPKIRYEDRYDASRAYGRSKHGRRMILLFVPLAYLAPVIDAAVGGTPWHEAVWSARGIGQGLVVIAIAMLHRRAFGRDDDGPKSPLGERRWSDFAPVDEP